MKPLVVGVTAAALMLGGCALFPDRTLKYQEAETIKEMDVPSDMSFMGFDDKYAVRNEDERLKRTVKRKDRFQVPEPPRLVALEEVALEQSKGPEPTNMSALLGRDGNGYPILMMNTDFTWAWEYVERAINKSTFTLEDVNRSIGVFYVKLPKRYEIKDKRIQFKLSHTVNGIQVAALNRRGTTLLEKDISQQPLEALREQLRSEERRVG